MPHGTALFRLSADPQWTLQPPAVDFGVTVEAPYPNGPPLAAPGSPATVTTAVTNFGVPPVLFPSVSLTAPAGWRVTATSPRSARALPGHDQVLATTWSVAPPDGTPPGIYQLTGTATYWVIAQQLRVVVPFTSPVIVPMPPPPAGTSFVSDLKWLRATSGWGPIEIDRSNGERPAGDGWPLTIGGVVFAKGLGAHAPSTIEYFVGGRCTSVTASVGVDDEKAANGTVTFEVWADGTRVADSGVLTTAMAAAPLSADVSGAKVVRLLVTDAGDGINSDHADWAGTTITCG